MKRFFAAIFWAIVSFGFSDTFPQKIEFPTPLEKCEFKGTTSYTNLIDYISALSGNFANIRFEVIGTSVQGRKIQLIHVVPAGNSKKMKVLLICQQHGDEPSGKEAALILLRKLATGIDSHIIDNLDVYIIPSANPDGSEAGKRANANDEDMNRNHLKLSQPEVIAIHDAYNSIHPDVTLDVHEYSAFRKDFRNAGYVRSDDEEFGAPTNPNVSQKVRDYALNKFFPFLNSELAKQGVTFSNYFKMDTPEDTVRASTTAINDGRQSFAILGSFSFILEGRNGNGINDELKRRASRQVIAIEKFLEFVNTNSTEIQSLVSEEQKRLAESNDRVALQMNYVYNGTLIKIPVKMLDTNVDTVVFMPYAPAVTVYNSVKRPFAYFIPGNLEHVIQLLKLHGISYFTVKHPHTISVEIYSTKKRISVWMENKSFKFPDLDKRTSEITAQPGDVIVPLNQTAGVMLVIALEPASMWGIIHSGEYASLCKQGSDYPIFRIIQSIGFSDEY